MHSKSKGNIGEARATVELMKLGLPVFTELGDSSKVDLITLVGDKPIKIQVKFCNQKKESSRGRVVLYRRSSGPSYEYRYGEGDIDVIAMYDPVTDKVGWVSIKTLCKVKQCMTFVRSEENIRSPQMSKIRMFDDYTDFHKSIENS